MTSTTSTTQPKSSADFRILWRCYGYLRPYTLTALGAYGGMLTISAFNLAVPQFIRWIIDNGITAGQTDVLAWAVPGLLLITLLKGVLTFFQGRWTEIASQSVAFDLRNAIQNKLTLLSFSFLDQSEAGQLLSRAVQDVERIRFLTGRATLRIAEGVVMALGTAALLVWMNPRLSLVVAVILPLLVHRALYLGGQLRPLGVRIQNQLGILTTRLEQNLRGIRVVKAFAQEEAEIERFAAENEAWFTLSNRNARIQAVHTPLLDLIANLGTVAMVGYGGWLVMQGSLTLGELVAFTTYLAQLFNPIRMLGMIIPAIAMAGAAAERIFEILDAIPDVFDRPGAPALPPITGHVRFERVSFAYAKTHKVLDDVSFEAQPGQIIALLGATGSGKTTIINLIPRFYDPTSGGLYVDGHNLRDVSLGSLRAQIGMVLQETTLFIGSIHENIAFGKGGASRAEVIAAAEAAQAHEFIEAMPKGYDTLVGERGVTLSGGQKQRIALARALLTDPRILILDDATASVDSDTERKIQAALDALMEGRTSFVIAHRLSTVRRADLIVVLQHGRIAALGRHDDLLASSALYREMVEGQGIQ